MSPIGAGSVARLACGAALVASTLGSAVACKPVELASGWAAGGIEVDGVDDEWIGATTYFEEQDVTIGLLNDAEFLYISLVSSGPVGRQAMATGLTVWFDPDGGTDEWYGIRHPVPPDGRALGWRPRRGRTRGRSRPGTGWPSRGWITPRADAAGRARRSRRAESAASTAAAHRRARRGGPQQRSHVRLRAQGRAAA